MQKSDWLRREWFLDVYVEGLLLIAAWYNSRRHRFLPCLTGLLVFCEVVPLGPRLVSEDHRRVRSRNLIFATVLVV